MVTLPLSHAASVAQPYVTLLPAAAQFVHRLATRSRTRPIPAPTPMPDVIRSRSSPSRLNRWSSHRTSLAPAPAHIRRSAFRDCARFSLHSPSASSNRRHQWHSMFSHHHLPLHAFTCCHKGHRRQYQWQLCISIRTWTDSRTSFVAAPPWSRFSPALQASDLNDSR
jgi:hypothetical protein